MENMEHPPKDKPAEVQQEPQQPEPQQEQQQQEPQRPGQHGGPTVNALLAVVQQDTKMLLQKPRPTPGLEQSSTPQSTESPHHGAVPPETIEYLKAWMKSPEHVDNPYPTTEEKRRIVADTGINIKQLSNWFANNRRRFWKPRVKGAVSAGPEHPVPAMLPDAMNVGLPQQPRGPSQKTAGRPAGKKGKKKQEKKFEKKSGRTRKSSSNLRPGQGRKPKVHIIDDDPHRLTNPLVDYQRLIQITLMRPSYTFVVTLSFIDKIHIRCLFMPVCWDLRFLLLSKGLMLG